MPRANLLGISAESPGNGRESSKMRMKHQDFKVPIQNELSLRSLTSPLDWCFENLKSSNCKLYQGYETMHVDVVCES